jgi:uncharacterized alkaline shock family protein YloU
MWRKDQSMTQQRSSGQQSPLKTDKGNTVIQDSVVAQVAGIAAQEVEGVQMGGGTTAAVSGFISGVTGSVTGGSNAPGGSNPSRGVTVEVGEEETAVDLSLAVEYGKSIPQISQAVRQSVINRVESLVGLRVNEVNIDVTDVQFREERPMLERQQQVASEAREQEN